MFRNYIKPSQVSDFARTTYRHTAPMAHTILCPQVRIIYRSLNSAESLDTITLPYRSYTAKVTKITRFTKFLKKNIGPIELLISTPLLICGAIYWVVSL